MVNRFTPKAQLVLQGAKKNAEKMGHTYIGTEHLLLGILGTDCVAGKILEEKNITYSEVYDRIVEISGVGSFSNLSGGELTPKCKKIIEGSSNCAKRFKGKLIGSEHILFAICEDNETVAGRILSSGGINLQILKNEISVFLDQVASSIKASNKNEIPSCPVLSQYGKNLNTLAIENKLDPLFCRENEVLRLIQILSRRTKNNPCLIGEPGVGKTSIVEGLAKRIVDGDVPDDLKNKIVVSLDLSSMIAGAKYRGEFEERMKGVLNELQNSDNLILFIDEIHTIIGAGSAEGALDASNIIKPFLARGNLQVIGATTTKEYRRYIEKDSALERRFQPITVNEPTRDEAVKILMGLRDRYEKHHGVKITDEAIYGAVDLSIRYINDRYLPDKAIDLIDEASSYIRINHYEYSPKLKELESRLNELFNKKEEAILREDFSLASAIHDEEIMCKLEYNKEETKNKKALSSTIPFVTYEAIAEVVTKWTSVPVSNLNEREESRLKNLEELLSKRVIGQSDAIKSVAGSIKRGRLGLKNPKRPIGAFLFLGPTGVGKTELSKAICQVVFGSESNIIRIDMSEYMEKHSVSRLIGSPPGYVGYEEGGQLSEAVRSRPYSLVLFDEIEKAHPDVYNILLQVMEDGVLTDSQGRKIDFKNTILIMTSNIGAKNITQPKKLGFGNNERDENEIMKGQINEELKREFNPEFLNRLDEIIIFNRLNYEDICKISEIMLSELSLLCKNIGIELKFDSSVYEYIAGLGYDKQYGARPLRRIITNQIENAISDKLLEGEIRSGDSIKISYRDKLEFNINKNGDVAISTDQKQTHNPLKAPQNYLFE